jgi:hypothetical protein
MYVVLTPVTSPPETCVEVKIIHIRAADLSHFYCTVPRTRYGYADVISTRSASAESVMTDVIVTALCIGKFSIVCTNNFTVH